MDQEVVVKGTKYQMLVKQIYLFIIYHRIIER